MGYVLKIDGAKYYITGDTEPMPQMAGINPDVIFPLFYGCGGNLDNALKMTYISKARVVVPVHFSSGTGDVDPRVIENVKKYIAKLNGVKSAYYKEGKLILTQ